MNKITTFILISLILFLVAETSLCSQGTPPPVTKGQPMEKPSESSTTGDIETQNSNNTAQKPMPGVKQANATKTNTTTEYAHKKKSNKESGSNDDSTPIYTFLLTIFTGLLVVCNILLWKATKKSADAAKESAELTRKGFISTHHPRLRVHSIRLKKLDTIPDFTNGSSPITHRINCSIDNIGSSTATITGISIVFKRLNDPLPVPSYGKPIFIKKPITCGESITESCDVGAFVIDNNIERGLNDLYFFGYIDYRDNIGTTRRTAFCRRYIRETKRFVKVDDEDYEYSY
jgi:hypothetical protein